MDCTGLWGAVWGGSGYRTFIAYLALTFIVYGPKGTLKQDLSPYPQ